ncbi:MAG: hypothetical protein V1886_01160 [archaeon]
MALTKVKKIPPVPIALAAGLVNAVLGLVLGILTAVNLGPIVSLLAQVAGISGITLPQLNYVNAGALLIVGYPIGGFVVGFLGTIIVVFIYNIVAKKIPIRMELK